MKINLLLIIADEFSPVKECSSQEALRLISETMKVGGDYYAVDSSTGEFVTLSQIISDYFKYIN